ncbi:hypothetical protein C0995_007042 [Termitomyces sp. Mi166|nr:hypothetical protein C0995_007042 [Termitomyces sp. Mi166\
MRGKEIRAKFIEAFNVWLDVPAPKQSSHVSVDDIEDDSQLRRGQPDPCAAWLASSQVRPFFRSSAHIRMHYLRRAELVFDLLLVSTSSSLRRPLVLGTSFFFELELHSDPLAAAALFILKHVKPPQRPLQLYVGTLALAAQSVGRSSEDIDTFVKLAEGGFNRTFLITMHDGFEMVARIPYPVTVPKFYTFASEVATMRFLCSFGLPVPEVYGYSPSSDNAARTEYIFMEFVRGTKLSDIWLKLEEADVASVLRQLAQLESQMMSIPFPAGGSLYYTDDLQKVAGRTVIPLKDERFSIGPDARLHMWYGRRLQLDVNRGSYENAEAALVAVARKELAYLEQFDQPLLPFQRERREAYGYKKQSPSDHIKNLERYLLIAPSLIPENPSLHHFCIRHPNLQLSNIIVSKSPDSNQLQIVSLLDWQHASILPPFLTAEMPGHLQNYDDPISQLLVPPSVLAPTNMDELNEYEQSQAMELYHRRLSHFYHVKNTEEYNKLHHDALTDPVSMFLCRLFYQAGYPWEGETHALKATLIEATEMWDRFTGESASCPVVFDPEDLRKTKEPGAKLQAADENFEGCRGIIGFDTETWVSNERYETAAALGQQLKEKLLAMIEEEQLRADVEVNWFLNDMDEKDYM